MLHTETVTDETMELIRTLQSDKYLKDFVLVGGTALSLQIGHRISIDIDLFTKNEFDNQFLLEYFESEYEFQVQYLQRNTMKGIIGGVFVDLLRHNYPYIKNPISQGGIILASKEDIAAMKVNSITGNGTRVKDFIDIYFLLKEFSFAQLIEFYKIKYKTRNDFHAIKSLTWFDEIIAEAWPNMLLEKELTLDHVQKEILYKSEQFLKK